MDEDIIKHDNAVSSWITLRASPKGVITTILMVLMDLNRARWSRQASIGAQKNTHIYFKKSYTCNGGVGALGALSFTPGPALSY
jgi:hypothetical protein